MIEDLGIGLLTVASVVMLWALACELIRVLVNMHRDCKWEKGTEQ